MSLLYLALMAAVRKVDDEADYQPDHESNPRRCFKAIHHVRRDHNSHNWSKWNPRSDECAFYFRTAHAQNPNPGAHDDEREQGADGNHFAKNIDGSECAREGNANSHEDGREIWRPKARMNFTGPAGQQAISRH